jgi:hypothetical protein
MGLFPKDPSPWLLCGDSSSLLPIGASTWPCRVPFNGAYQEIDACQWLAVACLSSWVSGTLSLLRTWWQVEVGICQYRIQKRAPTEFHFQTGSNNYETNLLVGT